MSGTFSDVCPGFFCYAWVACFFIRNLRLAWIVFWVFINEEFLIALVDFIAPCGGVIRKLRLASGFHPGFTNGEYHIVCVDFICSSRGRLERDRGFANPLSLSNTSPDPWGVSAAAGYFGCRGLGTILESGIRCYRYSPVPNVVLLSVFGSVSFAFQSGCLAGVVRFSLLGGGIVCSCSYVWFCFFFRRICANRDWVVCLDW